MQTNVLTVTDDRFSAVVGQHKLVLVDFWAGWCGPCRSLAPVLEQLAELYKEKEEVAIGKLDIDVNPVSTQQYAISTLPTIVIFRAGLEVERLSGFHPLEKLQQTIERHLH